jgi:hypothetical protein
MRARPHGLDRLSNVMDRRSTYENDIRVKLLQSQIKSGETFRLEMGRNVLQPFAMRIASCYSGQPEVLQIAKMTATD